MSERALITNKKQYFYNFIITMFQGIIVTLSHSDFLNRNQQTYNICSLFGESMQIFFSFYLYFYPSLIL